MTFEVGNGLYNTQYLEVLFHRNSEAIKDFEYDAFFDGVGPLVSNCPTVYNFTSVKVNCRMSISFDHLIHR